VTAIRAVHMCSTLDGDVPAMAGIENLVEITSALRLEEFELSPRTQSGNA
jgi:hypothetical protein